MDTSPLEHFPELTTAGAVTLRINSAPPGLSKHRSLTDRQTANASPAIVMEGSPWIVFITADPMSPGTWNVGGAR